MNTFQLTEIAFSALEQRKHSPGLTGTAPECNRAEPEGPGGSTAGFGPVEAGVSRYWTVKVQAGGRTHYVHVIACDPFKANLLALKRYDAISAEVLREIDREEYEHLTRVPA